MKLQLWTVILFTYPVMAAPLFDLQLTIFKLFISTLTLLSILNTPPIFFESTVWPLPLITKFFKIVMLMSPSIDLSRV